MLHKLLIHHGFPVPAILFLEEGNEKLNMPYAIMEFVEGKLLRDIILYNYEKTIASCSYEAGKWLAKLLDIKYPEAGFFDDQLNVIPFSSAYKYANFADACLEKETVREALGEALHFELRTLINANAEYWPSEENAYLVHADYDPANILVQEINEKWEVTAILDWEFAFAGNHLMDVGEYLRSAHLLPPMYETSFIKGFQEAGGILNKGWKKTAKLLDILSLLSLLDLNPKSERPNVHQDVISFIKNSLANWPSYD